MSTASGKSRLPKAYSDAQLGFLKSHLAEFERRTQGSVRGDAKKFALEKAGEFIVTFGLPPEFAGVTVEEAEGRFREQIYNWFKNTVGRTRRKLEGRPRSVKKADWTPPPQQQQQQQQQPITASISVPPPTSISAPPPPPPPPPPTVVFQPTSLTDAFLHHTDPNTLASLILSSLPSSRLQLDPTLLALFHASQDTEQPHDHIRLLLSASTFFPQDSLSHASITGPHAATTALQMHIRRNSIWVSQPSPSPSNDLAEEMHRIALDRQRKKTFITWARIHAAAIELGVVNDPIFSDLVARDAVWQTDEVEWVAGVYILRALIRTSQAGVKQKYDGLLAEYEARWREIRDETRQALVTDVLLTAREDMAQAQAQAQAHASPAMHHAHAHHMPVGYST